MHRLSYGGRGHNLGSAHELQQTPEGRDKEGQLHHWQAREMVFTHPPEKGTKLLKQLKEVDDPLVYP
jgi:hypothetical protein